MDSYKDLLTVVESSSVIKVPYTINWSKTVSNRLDEMIMIYPDMFSECSHASMEYSLYEKAHTYVPLMISAHPSRSLHWIRLKYITKKHIPRNCSSWGYHLQITSDTDCPDVYIGEEALLHFQKAHELIVGNIVDAMRKNHRRQHFSFEQKRHSYIQDLVRPSPLLYNEHFVVTWNF